MIKKFKNIFNMSNKQVQRESDAKENSMYTECWNIIVSQFETSRNLDQSLVIPDTSTQHWIFKI